MPPAAKNKYSGIFVSLTTKHSTALVIFVTFITVFTNNLLMYDVMQMFEGKIARFAMFLSMFLWLRTH